MYLLIGRSRVARPTTAELVRLGPLDQEIVAVERRLVALDDKAAPSAGSSGRTCSRFVTRLLWSRARARAPSLQRQRASSRVATQIAVASSACCSVPEAALSVGGARRMPAVPHKLSKLGRQTSADGEAVAVGETVILMTPPLHHY